MSAEIVKGSYFVSDKGGIVDFVRDGEVLASVAVPPGRVRASEYLGLLPEGAEMQVSKGVAVVRPRHRVGIQPYGAGSHDSGANPSFKPTSASRMERELRVTLNRMKAVTSRVEARERALSSIERIPSSEVIEEIPQGEILQGNPAPEENPMAKPARDGQ